MNANRKQILIVAVLAIVLLAVIWHQFLRGAPAGPPPASAPASSASVPSGPDGTPAAPQTQAVKAKTNPIDLDELLAGIQTDVFDFDAEKMPRDPMRPLVGAAALRPVIPSGAAAGYGEAPQPMQLEAYARRMRVTGIIWDPYKPVAVVENEVVWPGYEFPQGISVHSIGPRKVNLKVHDSMIAIELEEK